MRRTRGPVLLCGEGRSGTTLLSVLLDGHPDAYFGPELHFRGPKDLGPTVLRALGALRQNPALKPRELNADLEMKRALQFVNRVERSDISLAQLESAVVATMETRRSNIETFADRAALIESLLGREAERRRCSVWGFKIMRDLILWKQYLACWPGALFVLIVRDGRDVAASQMKDHSSWGYADIDSAAHQWKRLIRESRSRGLERSVVTLRYEDLVRDPESTLTPVLRTIGLQWDESMENHHLRDRIPAVSKRHPSASQVREPVNSSAVGRFHRDLSHEQVARFNALARRELIEFGYVEINQGGKTQDGDADQIPISTILRPLGIVGQEGDEVSCESTFGVFQPSIGELGLPAVQFNSVAIRDRRRNFERKRKYSRDDYARLVEKLSANNSIQTLRRYVNSGHPTDAGVLLLRHDIDHDIENAVRIAHWEAAQGIQSTFCVLHTAWYYGEFISSRYRHSTLVLESLAEIQALGHEINLHNNFITLALDSGTDPVQLLADELGWLRSEGIHVDGTSTHGDRRCRELGYRNFELFSQAIGTKFGGPRTLKDPASGFAVELGRASYADFDLTYEAYDFHRDLYVTDSGGRLRERKNAEGRRNFGRKEGEGRLVGLLTHPIWWGGF